MPLVRDARNKRRIGGDTCRQSKAHLQKLTTLYHPASDNQTSLPNVLANLTHIHTGIDIAHGQTTETKLYKPYTLYPEETTNGAFPIPDDVYDALHICFNIQRVIYCNPINLPLRAKNIYFPRPPRRSLRGFPLHQINMAWCITRPSGLHNR